MDIDIRIYLKRLKEFFKTDAEARRDMFGKSEIDMEDFYKMVEHQATINRKKAGDPMLSTNQMLEIVTDLAIKDAGIDMKAFIKKQQEIEKLFIHIKDGFPPFCLN